MKALPHESGFAVFAIAAIVAALVLALAGSGTCW